MQPLRIDEPSVLHWVGSSGERGFKPCKENNYPQRFSHHLLFLIWETVLVSSHNGPNKRTAQINHGGILGYIHFWNWIQEEMNQWIAGELYAMNLKNGQKIVAVVEKQAERSDRQSVLRVVTLEFLVNLQHVQQIRKSRWFCWMCQKQTDFLARGMGEILVLYRYCRIQSGEYYNAKTRWRLSELEGAARLKWSNRRCWTLQMTWKVGAM